MRLEILAGDLMENQDRDLVDEVFIPKVQGGLEQPT